MPLSLLWRLETPLSWNSNTWWFNVHQWHKTRFRLVRSTYYSAMAHYVLQIPGRVQDSFPQVRNLCQHKKASHNWNKSCAIRAWGRNILIALSICRSGSAGVINLWQEWVQIQEVLLDVPCLAVRVQSSRAFLSPVALWRGGCTLSWR